MRVRPRRETNALPPIQASRSPSAELAIALPRERTRRSARATFAHRVGRPLGLDPLLLELRESYRDEVLAGVGEHDDPVEAVARLGARLFLQQALRTKSRGSSVASAVSAPAARGSRPTRQPSRGWQRVSPSRRIVQQLVAQLFSSPRRLRPWRAICARLSPVGNPAGSRALVSNARWPGRFACRRRRNREIGCRCRGRARGRRERLRWGRRR